MPKEIYVELIPLINGHPPDPEDMDREKVRTWLCPGCGCFVDWEFGADDDLGHLCDDCWFEEVNPHKVCGRSIR